MKLLKMYDKIKKNKKSKKIAVDFDGTLCKEAYPYVGKRLLIHKLVAKYIRYKKKKGYTIILNTLRDHNNHIYGSDLLKQAIEACKRWNVPIDLVNDNLESATEKWGYSRKIGADLYIDDRNIGFIGWLLRKFK